MKLSEALEEAKAKRFDRVTTTLRVGRKSSTVMVYFWDGPRIVHKIQVNGSPERVAAEAARERIVSDVHAAFPDYPVN